MSALVKIQTHTTTGGFAELPDLIVRGSDLPASARELRDLLAAPDRLFDRGMPVRLTADGKSNLPTIQELTAPGVVMEAHRVCRPVKLDAGGSRAPVTLPDRLANLYLSMRGEWRLRQLDGITTAPLLADDGAILDRQGYDAKTRLWCAPTPDLQVSPRPSRLEAETALLVLRSRFRTFPFADATLIFDDQLGVHVIDITQPAGADESAMLAGLLTAIARPSLWLSPGLLVRSASVSGAGTGKGLLVRAVCQIAFGVPPRAFTAGSDRQELDKRLAAELVEAGPVLFLDNVNSGALKSELLASVMTERPARVRVLGRTRMVPLNSTAFVTVTGNGLTVSEDLARRFITCDLDARIEDPESRPFSAGFLAETAASRVALMTAALTIWRWGRHNTADLKRGQPLGSFERWTEWVRDPLLTLGCVDPVLRVADAKASDPHRRHTSELFHAWHEAHGDRPIKASDLAESVRLIADLQGRGRQWLAAFLDRLNGTRMAGFVLSAQRGGGRWSATTYALTPTGGREEHRDHREHRP